MRPLPVKTHDVEQREWLETQGDICVRMVHLNMAEFVPQHSHEYGHTTLLANGAVSLWIEGLYQGDLTAPFLQYIEPNKDHTYQALTDNTVMACISKQGAT